MKRPPCSRTPEHDAEDTRDPSGGPGPHTLGIDIGGTALKASVLDRNGQMIAERARMPTPYPCPPMVLLRALVKLTAPLPSFDRISIGFPGVVRGGHVVTAPHFSKKAWRGYPLEAAVAQRLGRPARLLNDAEVQGLAVIAGHDLEVVLTLGTGIGSAVFLDGWLAPHLELAQHPLHNGEAHNEYAGNEALHRLGKKKWNRQILRTIEAVDSLLHYDVLYLGGGNARHLTVDLPRNVKIASNDNGIIGGIHLWDRLAQPSRRPHAARRAGAWPSRRGRIPNVCRGKSPIAQHHIRANGKHAITWIGQRAGSAHRDGARRLRRRLTWARWMKRPRSTTPTTRRIRSSN
jgi:polyphosphate glucokinase